MHTFVLKCIVSLTIPESINFFTVFLSIFTELITKKLWHFVLSLYLFFMNVYSVPFFSKYQTSEYFLKAEKMVRSRTKIFAIVTIFDDSTRNWRKMFWFQNKFSGMILITCLARCFFIILNLVYPEYYHYLIGWFHMTSKSDAKIV